MVKQLTVKPTKKRTAVGILLYRRGYELRTIANAVGCSVEFISMVVSGVRRSEKVERLIADTLGLDVEALFPPRPTFRGRRAA